MNEPRFKCPQWPTDPSVPPRCAVTPNTLTLPEVLQHWRWHTEQAAELWPQFCSTMSRYVHPEQHLRRMSPAFTLTLIDQQERLLTFADELRYGHSPGLAAYVIDRVVAVVTAAGYEAVTDA